MTDTDTPSTFHLIELPDLLQGSDEWHDQRRGIITASVVGRLITARTLTAIDYDCPACDAPADGPCLSKRAPRAPIKTLHPERVRAAVASGTSVIEPASNPESRALTAQLAAERITGWTDPTYMNDDMLRGVEDEPRAIAAYEKHTGDDVTLTGFMIRDDFGFKIGYSPDGLVGDDGLLEVKSRRQKKHLQTILADEPPPENMAQLQCGLLVSGRAWIDYVSYSGGMHLYPIRVYPDPIWFEAIVAAVQKFEQAAELMVATYEARTLGLPLTERVIEEEMVF